MSDVNLPLHE